MGSYRSTIRKCLWGILKLLYYSMLVFGGDHSRPFLTCGDGTCTFDWPVNLKDNR